MSFQSTTQPIIFGSHSIRMALFSAMAILIGPNKGRWSVKPQSNILTLDSDVDDDDSEWIVVVDGNLGTLTGRGHERKENTTLLHRRVRE